MGKIRVAVIGAGYWGSLLAARLYESPAFELLAVADIYRGRGDCHINEVLDRDDVQAVAVATPASTHFDVVSAFLRRGVHVLCEKPLALSYDDAEFLCGMADESRVSLMCDLTYLYAPALQVVRNAVVELGEVRSFVSARMHTRAPDDVNALHDLMPHDLAIHQAVAPTWWERGAADIKAEVVGDAEQGVAVLRFYGHGMARLQYSRRWDGKVRQVTVGCAEGEVSWVDNPTPVVRMARYGAHETYLPVPAGEPVTAMLAEWERSLSTKSESLSSGRSCLAAIAVIEELNKSLEANRGQVLGESR